MTSRKELKVVIGLAAYLLLVGALCYAFFPAEAPDEPIRKMFDVAAGKVLFDHKTHTDQMGYGLSCKDCHHHPMEDDEDLRPCAECHPAGAGNGDDENEVPESCMDCHDLDEIEDSEAVTRTAAFHNQCILCHQEFEAGPEECASCHIL